MAGRRRIGRGRGSGRCCSLPCPASRMQCCIRRPSQGPPPASATSNPTMHQEKLPLCSPTLRCVLQVPLGAISYIPILRNGKYTIVNALLGNSQAGPQRQTTSPVGDCPCRAFRQLCRVVFWHRQMDRLRLVYCRQPCQQGRFVCL